MVRPLISYFETFLLHDSYSEEGRLLQHGDGSGVRDRRQTDVIHLETQHQSAETTPSLERHKHCPMLCVFIGHVVLKGI